jgi:hypothetical protein
MKKPLDYARFRFQQGLEAEARGEAFRIAPRELMARICERVETEWLAYARDLWNDRAAAADRGEFSEGTTAEMMARIRARVERPAT